MSNATMANVNILSKIIDKRNGFRIITNITIFYELYHCDHKDFITIILLYLGTLLTTYGHFADFYTV